jgi:FAD/FMN-containing dehydrogenase
MNLPKIKGDVRLDNDTLNKFSHDASIFEVKPKAVIFPKDAGDIKTLVKFASENEGVSLTPRSGGTDMSGGPLNNSIILAFEKYFNKLKIDPRSQTGTAQPGVYYRNFEKETLKHKLIFPSYPASKEICAIGGIVSNNSGGEKSLRYGKTEDYITRLKIILSDGNEYEFRLLNKSELRQKLVKKDFEGEIYRKIHSLIINNYDLVMKAKPKVHKNSAGYFLWNVYDKEKETFDLTNLFIGSQGTLGIVTEATLKLVPLKNHQEMVTIFINDFEKIAEIVNLILPLGPESMETYDDKTLKLATKYFYTFAKKMGARNIFSLFFQFLPELWLLLRGGVPKLVLQVEFNEDNEQILKEKVNELLEKIKPLNLRIHTVKSQKEENKYWIIRRESFNLLRQKIKDKHTAPFIDDFVVAPQYLSDFLPKLEQVMNKYPNLIYTIAGHLGEGNFHIIPLMNIERKEDREIIPKLSKEVYDLVLKYKGSITGEHNDGIIRTPYLRKMYGEKVYKLFEETKKIFDPKNIFNPGKKVGGSLEYAMSHIRTNFS